jgi:hypothetical protein
VTSRYILHPLRIWDCDRPVNASAASLFTTAECARDMRQPPVYVLNHAQHHFRQRTTQPDLDEIEDGTDRVARRMFEGAGLGPQDVDIFNPYDGYATMTQFFLRPRPGRAGTAPMRTMGARVACPGPSRRGAQDACAPPSARPSVSRARRCSQC